MKSRSRREFIRESVAGAAAGTTVLGATAGPASSYANIAGANDRIRVGLIGCGGQGRADLSKMIRVKDVECIALCDVDDDQVGQSREDGGGPARTKAVLQLPRLPPAPGPEGHRRRHRGHAGPLARAAHDHGLPGGQGRLRREAALGCHRRRARHGGGSAQVQPCRPDGHAAAQRARTTRRPSSTSRAASSGKIRLVRAWAYLDWKGETPVMPDSDPPPGVDYDMWLGPARKRPFNKNRFHFTFRWYWDYSGGLMTDWGAHMIDIANWAMGIKAPSSAMSARRQVRLSERRDGDAGHPAGDLGLSRTSP